MWKVLPEACIVLVEVVAILGKLLALLRRLSEATIGDFFALHETQQTEHDLLHVPGGRPKLVMEV